MLCLVGRCLPIFNVAAFSVEISFAFLGKILLIFLLIYLLAELTPKIAKKIDAHIEKHKKSPEDERLYSVRSAFEPHDTDEKPERTFFPELKEHQKNQDNINKK